MEKFNNKINGNHPKNNTNTGGEGYNDCTEEFNKDFNSRLNKEKEKKSLNLKTSQLKLSLRRSKRKKMKKKVKKAYVNYKILLKETIYALL